MSTITSLTIIPIALFVLKDMVLVLLVSKSWAATGLSLASAKVTWQIKNLVM